MIQKSCIVIAVIVLCAGSIFCQDFERSITGKGLKIGPGYNMLSTTYDELEPYFDTKIGSHGGAFLTYQMSPTFSIQPEFMFSVKGASTGGLFTVFNWSLNYIEIPVLFKYHLSDKKAVKPAIYAGPSWSYLTSSELKVIFVDPIDVTEGMKRTDIGFIFGGGFDYKHFVFDIRYTIGVTNIIDGDAINVITDADVNDFYYFTNDQEVKNSFLSIMLGIKFY